MSKKIIIGNSDYSREQVEKGNIVSVGCSRSELLQVIENYERAGYEIKFETNLFRRIFGIGIYRIVAVM